VSRDDFERGEVQIPPPCRAACRRYADIMQRLPLDSPERIALGSDVTATDPRGLGGGSASVLAAGSLLAGRYTIEQFIAAGGMGEVHQAFDSLLEERIAVKLLRQDLSAKPTAQARFADEIRLARRVTHRNVCRVFDVGIDGPRVFFTMELHRGETMAAFLQRSGPLPVSVAAPLVIQMLAGVAAAHAADVVHADLKPSNILLVDGGARVIVTDFGMAVPCCASLDCDCELAHLVGTPAYMAPEQVTGGTILATTDVYSLGVILFEAMTGQLPFHGDTAVAMATARLDSDPPAPRTLRTDLDPRWEETILACLARDPAHRPASAPAIATSLGLA
jgi:eukaryotic-like serine/threonine-protein kinase